MSNSVIQIQELAKIFVVALVVSTVWAFVFVDYLNPIFENYFLIAYFVFMAFYSAITTYAITNLNPFESENFRKYLGFFIAFVIADIMLYPMMVTKTGVPSLPTTATISSDIFIYRLLPAELPEWFKYFVVYPLTFSIGITTVAWLARRWGMFSKMVKNVAG